MRAFGILSLFAAVAVTNIEASPLSQTLIQTEAGLLEGKITERGREFLGIPYAEPPVGERRWQAPQPHASWSEPRPAKEFASICPQITGETGFFSTLVGSEDCLYLNVYTPPVNDVSSPHWPVMVWLHGGSFESGAGSQYDPSKLAHDKGLVVVTLNYRLGALGFLAHPGLSNEAESHDSGNFGLLDQQLALRWVQQNIEHFGGDHHQVTLFGESAGGWSVCYQLVSPRARGLFQRAIIESGSCQSSIAEISLEQAELAGKRLDDEWGCHGDLACLRKVSISTLVRSSSRRIGIAGLGFWGAVYGDSVLPTNVREAFQQGRFNQVPIINGTNHDEGRLFAILDTLFGQSFTVEQYRRALQIRIGDTRTNEVLEKYPPSAFGSVAMAYAKVVTDASFGCPGQGLDRLLSKYTRTFAYEFNDPHAPISLPLHAEVPSAGAFHASEIAYVFQTPWLLANPNKFSPDQQKLSDTIVNYWANFAQTGDPNSPHSPIWESFDPSREIIQTLAPTSIGPTAQFTREHNCDFWSFLKL